MGALQQALMVSKRQHTMYRVADGPSPTGSVGDPSSYNRVDPDRGRLPTRQKPRKGPRGLGSEPYRDWSPSPGPRNELH